MKNNIYLRRSNKVYFKKETSFDITLNQIASLQNEVGNIGYTLSEKLVNRLNSLSVNSFNCLSKTIIKSLIEMKGIRNYKPMYPNFPNQIKQMSIEELNLINNIHYLGDWLGLQLLPNYDKDIRKHLTEKTTYIQIDLGSEEDYNNIFQNLMKSSVSISETDKEDLSIYLKETNCELLPEEIPFKENLFFIIKEIIKNKCKVPIKKYFNNATDVLRFITALSDGDISLSDNTKYKNLTRSLRRLMLSLLEECTNLEEDMLRHKQRWIRIGEILHPGEYKLQFPRSFLAFTKIRNNINIETFNKKILAYIESDNIKSLCELLKTRPTEFGRKLDYLLRNFDNKMILDYFEKIVEEIPTRVLMQMYTHFYYRNDNTDTRIFFPKSVFNTKFYYKNCDYKSIDKMSCDFIKRSILNTLIKRYKNLESIGKVYIDPKLKNYTVPIILRNASKSLKQLARFSRIDINDEFTKENNILRLFLYWKQGEERVDIDLSTMLLDNNYDMIGQCSYRNRKINKLGVYHSGDITSAPDGACEFIDLNINLVKEHDVRYIVMWVYSFTNQPMKELPECFAGWMTRKDDMSGEIFEPKTVKNKLDLTSDSNRAIPVIFDLKTKEAIWTDLSFNNKSKLNNIEHDEEKAQNLFNGIINTHKFNLYDLFLVHGLTRGKIVQDYKEADIAFVIENDNKYNCKVITPFDVETIIGKYL